MPCGALWMFNTEYTKGPRNISGNLGLDTSLSLVMFDDPYPYPHCFLQKFPGALHARSLGLRLARPLRREQRPPCRVPGGGEPGIEPAALGAEGVVSGPRQWMMFSSYCSCSYFVSFHYCKKISSPGSCFIYGLVSTNKDCVIWT